MKKYLYMAAVAFSAVCAYYGISSDSLTTWTAVFELAKNVALNPVAIASMAMAAWAYYKRNGGDTDGRN